MEWLKNTKIQSKLFLAFGIIVSLMILSNAFDISKFISMGNEYDSLISTSIQRQIYLADAIGDITKLRFHNLSRLYSLAGGAQSGAISELYKNRAQIAESFIKNLNDYRSNVIAETDMTGEEKRTRLEIVDEIDDIFTNVYIPYQMNIGNKYAQNSGITLLEGISAGNEITEKLQVLRKESFETVRHKSGEVKANMKNATNLAIAISACIVIFSVLFSIFIARSVKKRVSNMETAMAEISRGNLDFPIRSEYRDELGTLSNHIGDMVDMILEMNKTMAVIDYMDCMISIADLDYNVIYINDKMAESYGMDKENCIGHKCYKVLKGLDKPCSYCLLPQILSGDEQVSDDNRGYFWDEKLGKWLYDKAAIIRWIDGSKVQFHYLTDETMKRNYEENLREAKLAAEAASHSKSAFLANMSHEIRTPMNAIVGITEILLENEDLPQDMKESLDKIYNSGDLLLGIINDILDFSKIEAGKLELAPDIYRVASLINDTVQLNRMKFENKPVEFKLHVDETIPSELCGDELRIKQILNNLLSNAAKYTDSGEAELSVSAEFDSGNEGTVTLVFCVRDTGHGMTEEQLSKLYDEYSRFHAGSSTIEGIGLGMSITRNLIWMMEGEISAESEPEKGSIFTVRLPQGSVGADALGRDVAENLEKFRASDVSQMKKQIIKREHMPYGSVLIVDDTESNIYVAQGLMRPYGLQTDTAMSGFEAIEKIRDGKTYDIVFMDHMMPKMNGMQATKIIRTMGYANPIVALTANAVTGQADVFLANGFDAFISKPIDIRQLDDLLNKLIKDKHSKEAGEIVCSRSQNNDETIENDVTSTRQQIDPQLAEFTARDAEKTVAVLEAMHGKFDSCSDEDMETYVINVHGMKSVLRNVGETKLSDFALRLEQAGRNRDIAVMSSETGAFLDALRAVIKKIRPKEEEESSDIVDEDKAYLREKLLAVKEACAEYEIGAAEEILEELKRSKWSLQTKKILSGIYDHLLHSDLTEAADAAEEYIKVIETKSVS
ncbi:MAG: ATP-binding protein [Synergistaceae bacterium]|nr:ATP-binding protein [Synergistaceae bacterium]